MDFDYVPNLLEDDDEELAAYDQRTFKADARIFHKDAWTRKVPRDRANVTLPALVKEFNAAFGNKEGRKRIREEYEAAQSKYINEILDQEDMRAYPDPKTCRATKLPCIPNNFFRFFQLFQKYDLDQKHREKMLDREREQVRREMAEMRKALWVYRKYHSTKEDYKDLQKRADDQLRFYIVSDSSEEEDSDEEQEEEVEQPAQKKQKVVEQQSDGSGGGGSSSSSSQPEVIVLEQKKKKKKLKIKKKSKSTPEELCECCKTGAPPQLNNCRNGCGNKMKHMCGTARQHNKKISSQIDLTYTCSKCFKEVLNNIDLLGKLVACDDKEIGWSKGKVIKKKKTKYEVEWDEYPNDVYTRKDILKLMSFYDEHF